MNITNQSNPIKIEQTIVSIDLILCLFFLTGCSATQPKKTEEPNIYNYHAVIELTEIVSGKKHITVKEEWFKKPEMLRQEIFIPGEMKKVLIFDGEKSWAYFPLSARQVAFRKDFDHTPSFYAYRVSEKALELLKEQKALNTCEIDGHEVYVFQDESRENDLTSTFKVWLDKTTLFPLRWEAKSHNSESKMIEERICKTIEYDVEIPDDLFKLPPGFKTAEEEILPKEPITAKAYKGELTPQYLNQLLCQEKDLDRIIEKDPNNAAAYAQLGNLILIKGEYERAIQLLKKSIEIDPKQLKAYMSLVDVYRARGELNKAIQCMDRAEKLFIQKAFYYYELGNLYEEAGLIKKAVTAYKRAVDLQPDDLVNDSGVTYTIKGVRNKYVEAYNKALKKLQKGKSPSIQDK